MDSSLRGYTRAVLEIAPSDDTPVGLDAVVRGLRQISDITETTPALTRAITDEMVPKNARRAIMVDLFGEKVAAPAMRIVSRAVTIAHADDLLSVLGEVAELGNQLVALGSEQLEAEESLLGRIGARKLAAGYATAVFEDQPAVADIEEIEDELFRFARTVESSDALSSALSDSSRPIQDRRRLITDLLDNRARPSTVRLARESLHGRSRDPVGALDWMAERAAEARGWRVARVTSGRGLDEQERDELERALRDLTGGPVELLVTEDSELIGGAVVTVGNLLVDASIQHKLDQIHEQLLGSDHLARASTN
jgi:F-type H+-transporting ATPase subunit delta